MVSSEVTSLRASLTADGITFDRTAYNAGLRSADLSQRTNDEYAADYRHFTNWCEKFGAEPTPVSEELILLYLYYWGAPTPPDDVEAGQPCSLCQRAYEMRTEHGGRMLKVSTLSRRLTGIRMTLRDQGMAWPEFTDDHSNSFRNTINHLATEQAYDPKRAEAISQHLMAQLVNACADTPKGIRDRAIILLGFLGALRRKEISHLDLADVTFNDEGMTLRIRDSKTDKRRSGQIVYVPYRPNHSTCAVRAVQAWLQVRGTEPGPLFVRTWRGGVATPDRLSAPTIRLLVKNYVKQVGGDPAIYSAHSLRRGFVTSSVKANAPLNAIQKQTRHKHMSSLEPYVQQARGFKDNAVNFLKDL